MRELSARRFGLEFELLNTHSVEYYGRRLTPIITEFGGRLLVSAEYRHSDGRQWELKRDGSCGWEVVTPAISWKQWSQVESVLAALRASDAEVDDRCGLHVHHEIRDFKPGQVRSLLLLWMLFEDMMYCAVDPSRMGNEFCQSVRNHAQDISAFLWQTRTRNYFENFCNDMLGHHSVLNCSRYWQLGLVEFRLHHGSLDAQQTRWWVMLTQGMVELARTRNWKMAYMKYNELPVPRKLRLMSSAMRKFYDQPEVLEAVEAIQKQVQKYNPAVLGA